MAPITPELTDELRRRLVEHRIRLMAELDALRRQGMGQPLRDSVGELSSYDQHTSDLGSETFERSKDLALIERAALTLGEVEQALRRLDSGRYGWCEECGQYIGDERLLALPYARRCVPCQERHDQREQEGRLESRAVGKRPLEEAALLPPFGRADRLTPDDPGLTAEDVWQMVARYGNANSPQDVPGAVDYDEAWESADTDEPGGVQEVEFVADVGGTGVADPTQVYPDPSGAGRRRPRRDDEPDAERLAPGPTP